VADVEITVNAEKREPDTTGYHSIQEAEPVSLANCESETYGNQIHCCLVVSPAGRPLHAYRLVGELLEALRDAIRGHKSLLRMGRFFIETFPKTMSLSQKLQLRETQKGC